MLELRGGNDGLNTVVPYRDDRYYALRPRLALQRKRLLPLGDDQNAFARQLERLHRRFERGQLAVVQGVGYPDTNLSHFRSQDVWAAADPDDPQPRTGWLGRLHDDVLAAGDAEPTALLAVGTDVVPLALRGARSVPPAVGDPATFRLRVPGAAEHGERRLEALRRLNSAPARDERTASLQAAFDAARRASDRVFALRNQRPGAQFPGDSLGRALETVAKMIRGELGARCYHVTLDGFDTHTSQTQDHPALLGRLDAALDAFLESLEKQDLLRRVLVMTTSEFGRRPTESGLGPDAGTDHGTASMMFLAGGRVRGGVHGEQPDLASLDPNGNLLHTIDFRQVYATVIEGWLGGEATAVLGRRWPKLELFA